MSFGSFLYNLNLIYCLVRTDIYTVSALEAFSIINTEFFLLFHNRLVWTFGLTGSAFYTSICYNKSHKYSPCLSYFTSPLRST